MKKTVLLLLLLTAFYAQAQHELPIIREYKLFVPNSIDEVPATEYWENGAIKIDHEPVRDSIMLRSEYFPSGNLKLTAEVYRVYVIDTSMFEDFETGEFTMIINHGYSDMLHGKYTEYKENSDHSRSDFKTLGTMKNGTMVGEWSKRTDNSSKIVVNYNNKGQLEGDYYEYYIYANHQGETIKVKGQFGIGMTAAFTENLETGEIKSVVTYEVIRSGVWEYYDRKGNLMQTVTYEWKMM